MAKSAKAPIRARFEIRGDNEYMAWLAELRDIVVRAMELAEIDVKKLAELASLHPVTIRKFLEGKTFAPQLPTVYRILGAVGVALTTDNSPQPKRRRRRS